MILSIDTTTKKASVAIFKDKKIILNEIDNEITHSEKLLPLIDKTLKDSNSKLSDVDCLALTIGPGSFTGIRIGIATIKAIAKVINKKIFGITSLELLALGFINTSHKYILSTLDAKHNRVYFELYEVINNSLVSKNIYGNLPILELIELLKENNIQDMLVVSDNVPILKESFEKNFKDVLIENSSLDLRNIFKCDFLDDSHLYNYLNLDAKYYRASEAERTKFGE